MQAHRLPPIDRLCIKWHLAEEEEPFPLLLCRPAHVVITPAAVGFGPVCPRGRDARGGSVPPEAPPVKCETDLDGTIKGSFRGLCCAIWCFAVVFLCGGMWCFLFLHLCHRFLRRLWQLTHIHFDKVEIMPRAVFFSLVSLSFPLSNFLSLSVLVSPKCTPLPRRRVSSSNGGVWTQGTIRPADLLVQLALSKTPEQGVSVQPAKADKKGECAAQK